MKYLIPLLALMLATPLCAAQIHVPGDHATIGGALAAAGSGDIVLVAAGTYAEHDLQLKSGVTLRGAGPLPSAVVIDAGGAGRVLGGPQFLDGVTVEMLTLANGTAAYGGGMKLTDWADVTLRDLVFTGNHADNSGGGLHLDQALGIMGGGLLLERCRFENNEALLQGGGAAIYDPATVRFCDFTGNTSGNTGGGLDHDQGDLLIADSTFTGNAARLSGGGLRADGGTVRIQRCTFTGNMCNTGSGGGASATNAIVGGSRFEANEVGYHGGGLEAAPLLTLANCEFVDNHANSVGGGAILTGGTVTGCLFQGNYAGVNGGGLQALSSTASFEACSFIDNTALTRGGAFSNVHGGGAYTFNECTFSGSSAPNGPEGWFSGTSSVLLKCCDAEPAEWAEGNLTVDQTGCGVPNEHTSFGDLKRRFR